MLVDHQPRPRDGYVSPDLTRHMRHDRAFLMLGQGTNLVTRTTKDLELELAAATAT